MADEEDNDKYRKPNPGMWNFFIAKCNDGKLNPSDSFFVGGSAGRPKSETHKNKDHGDYDLKFAENANIKFYTDSDFFGESTKLQGPSLKGNKRGKRSTSTEASVEGANKE